jgi:hypothetical protein
MLAGLEMNQRIDSCFYEQRPPWCSTDEAAPWISQQLELLVFHIACIVLGIALCWCWQCLLTVGGNMLPHIVTILWVATVEWCYRQTRTFYTQQNARQEHCKHHSDSEQVFQYLTLYRKSLARLLQIIAIKIIWYCGLAAGQGIRLNDSTVSVH